MSGTVYLHNVSDGEVGIGLERLPRESGIPCVVPSSRLVRELKRRFHQGAERFFTFDQFVRWLLSLSWEDPMTMVAQELLVQRAVARVEENGGFHYFRRMTARRGWLKQVEARIGELKRAGVRPERLDQLWADRGEKYRELIRVYQAYQELLRRYGWVDQEEPYFQVCEALRREAGWKSLPEQVVVEQFTELTFMQQQVLIQLVTAGVDVSLHLVWDEKRPRLFRETARTVERLRQRGFFVRKMPQRLQVTEKAAPLNHLEQQAFATSAAPVSAEGKVEVLAASDVDHEVERVTARLREWLRDSGAALSEVALVCADPEQYESRLVSKLQRAGLPCERGQSISLYDHPLMQTLLGALSVRQGQEEKRTALMESAYLPWVEDGTMRSRWLRGYRLLGEPRSEADLLRRMEQTAAWREWTAADGEGLRALYRWVEEIPKKRRWREWVEWFARWSKVLKREDAWEEMGRDTDLLPMLVGEINAWEALGEVLEEWKTVFDSTDLGEGVCDLRSFIHELERAASGKEVELTPGRRGGIHLLMPNQMGGRRYRAVFMLGCAEGDWPRPIREDWLIPDRERLRLRREGVILATSAERRAQRLLPFYQSVQAATEHLVFSYPSMTAEGKGKLPSPFLDELLGLLTPDSVVQTSSQAGDLLPTRWEDCLSLAHGVEKAVDTLRRGSEEESETRRAQELLHRYRRVYPGKYRCLRERIQVERLRWSSRYTAFDGVLGSAGWFGERAHGLKDQVWSATALNELVQCRFHYMAGRVWGIQPRETAETGVSSLEQGEMFHRILSRFWDRYRDGGFDPDREEAMREHLMQVAEQVFQEAEEVGGWKWRDPFRVRIEKSRIRQQLIQLLAHECFWRRKVENPPAPRFLELGFGMAADPALVHRGEIDPRTRTSPAELKLAEDWTLRLRGKVDRVDMDADGYYALYDYKSGAAPSMEAIRSGDQLQLPLYLWVLQETFGLHPDQAVGAAYYTAAKRPEEGTAPTDNRNRGLWRKERAPLAGIGSRVGSLLEQQEWDQVQQRIRQRILQQLERAAQGDFAVAPARECPLFCPHRTVCRIDSQRMARKVNLEEEEEDQR
ncbi:ATP-dependent helicase/DNAse subunit B [Melghirimyces thermohalophilus]|uniref:ATP-dependent helicase/DNAse subunit B n=1 Tax=Melghirimyces thermohalophilus TaxID=1236220 RepID=A0A1G6KM87_9BACL|nr:PD-(D/E)XK nuclease family protein [Melghirimyces thermohalophilus]SDC31921.1 ATP-dependent helicase/DNAse subunit B [Melghirimyces thermohalophilus]